MTDYVRVVSVRSVLWWLRPTVAADTNVFWPVPSCWCIAVMASRWVLRSGCLGGCELREDRTSCHRGRPASRRRLLKMASPIPIQHGSGLELGRAALD